MIYLVNHIVFSSPIAALADGGIIITPSTTR